MAAEAAPEVPHILYLMIVGDQSGHIGRSTLLIRLASGEFQEGLDQQIGTDFRQWRRELAVGQVRVAGMDPIMQQRYNPDPLPLFSKSSVILLCYDIHSMSSLVNVVEAMTPLVFKGSLRRKVHVIGVGLKADLVEGREVDLDTARGVIQAAMDRLREQHRENSESPLEEVVFEHVLEVSAKTGVHMDVLENHIDAAATDVYDDLTKLAMKAPSKGHGRCTLM